MIDFVKMPKESSEKAAEAFVGKSYLAWLEIWAQLLSNEDACPAASLDEESESHAVVMMTVLEDAAEQATKGLKQKLVTLKADVEKKQFTQADSRDAYDMATAELAAFKIELSDVLRIVKPLLTKGSLAQAIFDKTLHSLMDSVNMSQKRKHESAVPAQAATPTAGRGGPRMGWMFSTPGGTRFVATPRGMKAAGVLERMGLNGGRSLDQAAKASVAAAAELPGASEGGRSAKRGRMFGDIPTLDFGNDAASAEGLAATGDFTPG